LVDYSSWHKLLKVHAVIFLWHLCLWSLVYFGLEYWMVSETYFDHFQEKLSRYYVIILAAQVVVLVGMNWALFKRVLAAFIYQEASPYNLALMRFAVMGSLAGHHFFYLPQKLAQVAALPDTSKVGLPFVGWMVDMMPVNPLLYQTMTMLGGVICLAAALGFKTRWTLVLSIPILFYTLGVPNFYGKLNHTHFMLWFPVFLAFSPAGDVFSVDALLRKRRGEVLATEPHYRYGVAMKLIFLQVGLIYFYSAVGKLWLSGLEWALSDNLVHLMRLEWLENYGDIPWVRLDNYPILCKLAAVSVIVFELTYIFLILTPKTRIAGVFSAVFFHTMTGYFLHINFIFIRDLNLFHLDWHQLLVNSRDQWSKWLRWVVFMAASVLLMSTAHLLGAGLFILGLVLFFRKAGSLKPEVEKKKISLSPWVMKMGMGLILVNMLFGLFQVNSWPFSAYPSYSFIREGTVRYVWFEPVGEDGKQYDLNKLCVEAEFKKENILPMAERVAFLHEFRSEKAFNAELIPYWLRLIEKVPALKSMRESQVLFQWWDTNPDRISSPIREKSLGRMVREGDRWQWFPA